MRDVLLASLVLSLLTVVPPLMVMTVIDQVVTHQSLSTLVLDEPADRHRDNL